MNTAPTQNAFSLALVSSTTRISNQFPTCGNAPAVVRASLGLIVEFRRAINHQSGNETVALEAMVPLFMVTSLLKIEGIH